jgi:hypothetical protein
MCSFNFYIFINVIHFFLQSTQDHHGHPWANAGFCPWQKREFHHAPSLSSRRTLIQLHCFSASYAAKQLFLLHWRVESLQLLWHTCNHSPRDYGQVPDNWLIFVDYLLVIYLRKDLCLCNIPKLGLFCVCKRSATSTFLFSNARWLFDNFQLSQQSVSVNLQISLNIYWQLLCGHFLVETDDNYSSNKAHLLDFW